MQFSLRTLTNLVSTLVSAAVWLWFITSFEKKKISIIQVFSYFGLVAALFFFKSIIYSRFFYSSILYQPVDALFKVVFIYAITRFILKQTAIISVMASLLIVFAIVWSENVLSPALFAIEKTELFSERFIFYASSLLFSAVEAILLLVLRRSVELSTTTKEQNRCLIFTVSPILMLTLLMRLLIDYQLLTLGNPNFNSIHSVSFMSLFNAFAIAICFASLFSFNKLMHYFSEEQEKSRLLAELTLQNKYIEEAKLRYELTSAFRHDLNNHLNILRGLLDKKSNEQATRYLSDISEASDTLSFTVNSGSFAVDVLLSEKLTLAKHLGIEVSCDVIIPSGAVIRDFDLCTIFMNSVDNAIQAASNVSNRKKVIDIKARPSGDFFVIDIINSYENDYRNEGQGYGIKNIKATVHALGGTTQIETGVDMFRITVLLPLSL